MRSYGIHENTAHLSAAQASGYVLAASKVPGVRAALCSDPFSTEPSIQGNSGNIMTMGSEVIGPELAKSLVTISFRFEYDPVSRSEHKIQRIDQYDKAR